MCVHVSNGTCSVQFPGFVGLDKIPSTTTAHANGRLLLPLSAYLLFDQVQAREMARARVWAGALEVLLVA